MDFQYTSDTLNLGSWRDGIPPDPSPPPNILYNPHPPPSSRDQWDGPIASFSATSLELEQFPNFFSLTPYSSSYKFGAFSERDIPVKGSHDIADALLSLKNAVVHPDLRGGGTLTSLSSRPSPPPPPLISSSPPPPPPPPPPLHQPAPPPPSSTSTSSTSSSSSSSSSNMPHLGSTPYPTSVGQLSSSTTAGYCVPSPPPGPHSSYSHTHGHPTYPHNHPPHSQPLPTYSINHDSLVMQTSYNGQPFPTSHPQYTQYPDPCLSPTLQHPGQTPSNVHFPSMSVNVSMSMNVGMTPNPNPNHYNCTGGNPNQAWMIQPPSPPPTLPPQPSLTVTHPSSAAQLLPQYGSTSSSSPSSASLPNQCNGYTPQFSHIVPEYRQIGPVDPRGVYYKPETPFKEKICQISHRHHAAQHAHHHHNLHHHHHHHPHSIIKRHHHRYNNPSERATLSAVTTSGLENNFLKTNLCRICGKTYARPSTLKTHLRTHSGEKPYKCSTCTKSFSQAANLTAHLRTHSGEKPFRCPVCQRRFSQSSSVTTHMRTHSGERPYRCRMCKKAFSDSSTLTKHLRIHSGEKPYQCKLCLLRFSQSGNLNRHMRVHTATM